MPSYFLQKIARGLKKPLRVVVWRLFQECRLSLMRISGAWSRIEKQAKQVFSKRDQAELIDSLGTSLLLIDCHAGVAFSEQHRKSPEWVRSRLKLADEISSRNFTVFGEPVPFVGGWPWSTDWRFDKTWGNQYFKTYNFYEKNKSCAWDIKFPWEVSRLTWVLPVFQAALSEPKKTDEYLNFIELHVHDWVRKNPYAYSVSWYPMEVAMRSVVLVMGCEFLAVIGKRKTDSLKVFLVELIKHGEFLWRTIEYSDVRGNHYFAEIAALFIISLRLRSWYPPANRWEKFSRIHLEREISAQFLEDGVHFEKSVPYHRLVLELGLLAALAAARSGASLKSKTLSRLQLATSYLAAVRRPDDLSPNIGDNDNAHILAFDPLPVRDHRALLELAACLLGEGNVWCEEQATSIPPLLFGVNTVCQPHVNLQLSQNKVSHYFFQAGGMCIAKTSKDFFICDFGEVGTCGRGGHGHNDLFSFELALKDDLLFIDLGCSVYTGDQQKRNKYRSTVSHNTVQVDSMEIAEMSGVWEIANTAVPCDVAMNEAESGVQFQASHDGYTRLSDPVRCTRTFNMNFDKDYFLCKDEIQCNTGHTIKRFLHCHPKLVVEMRETSAVLYGVYRKWLLSWGSETNARLTRSFVSAGYGEEEEGFLITLESAINSASVLKFEVKAVEGEIDETSFC